MSGIRNAVFVLWSGHLGGAERHTIDMVRLLRNDHRIDARVLFIEQAGRSGTILDALGIPWKALGFARGGQSAIRPVTVSAAVSEMGADVAFLGYGGYLARAIRTGGYKGVLISIEHGGILQSPSWTVPKIMKETFSRSIGEGALNGTICVSEFVKSTVMGQAHAPSVRVIYNGVDMDAYSPAVCDSHELVTFGHAARLIEGKGILNLVRAFDETFQGAPVAIRIAGEGPAREAAEKIVAENRMTEQVSFCGLVEDMPSFWCGCDVVVHPTTSGWKESFCLAVVEGMACGLPAIVSSEGALPEIVSDDRTGMVISPDDIPGLQLAMRTYVEDAAMREAHSLAAREWAVAKFELHRAAAAYVEYAAELSEACGRA